MWRKKQMQGLFFSVHPHFSQVRDKIWLCVGMQSCTWIRSVTECGCGSVCVRLCAWARELSVVIHKVTVQMFHGSKNVESPCLLLDSGNKHIHNTSTHAHRMTLLSHAVFFSTRICMSPSIFHAHHLHPFSCSGSQRLRSIPSSPWGKWQVTPWTCRQSVTEKDLLTQPHSHLWLIWSFQIT